MDLVERLDEVASLIAESKQRAFGDGVIIDKNQVLSMLATIRDQIPAELSQARNVVADADSIRQQAHTEAEHIIAEANERAQQLVAEDAILLASQQEGARIVAEAHQAAGHKQAEIDAYVESKLASFEGVLSTTLDAVRHGRAKLANSVDIRTMPEDEPVEQ